MVTPVWRHRRSRAIGPGSRNAPAYTAAIVSTTPSSADGPSTFPRVSPATAAAVAAAAADNDPVKEPLQDDPRRQVPADATGMLVKILRLLVTVGSCWLRWSTRR